MIPAQIKAPLRRLKHRLINQHHARHVLQIMEARSSWQLHDFRFSETAARIVGFLDSMKTDSSGVRFRYSAHCEVPTLYASAYACMSYGLVGALMKFDPSHKRAWLEYFDAHQSPEDGLFRDTAVSNALFDTADWWGARHLALHMISAYTNLGGRPLYPIMFLQPYHDRMFISRWLDGADWHSARLGSGDIDNHIMNIGCLLQYQRDSWGDPSAGRAVEHIKAELRRRQRRDTGMWGSFDSQCPEQRSRMVQFAYHLLPIFFFDRDFDFNHEKIAYIVLQTQNATGGFGVKLNSSACEDIDSIDILIRLAHFVSPPTRTRISCAIERAFRWVCANQVADGGFVFRLNEPFEYGHRNTASLANQGAMLPTWFRLLSIVYMANYFTIGHEGRITSCPGYEFL